MTWREALGQLAKSVFALVIVISALLLAGAIYGLVELQRYRAESGQAQD